MFISVFEPFPRLIHPPQNVDRKSRVSESAQRASPLCVWADDVLQRLIRNLVPYNGTSNETLAKQESGHCGWFITGPEVTVKAWWDIGSASKCV